MSKLIGIHYPVELKNLAINGAFDHWQEREAAAAAVNTAASVDAWSADMFAFTSGGATVKNYSIIRSADVPTAAQSGMVAPYSALYTQVSGIALPASGDFISPFCHRMEGKDFKEINRRNAAYGFWVKASVAGTYSFAIQNSTAQGTRRSYVTTFAVNSAATWEFKQIQIAMDQTANWTLDSGTGMSVHIGAVAGTAASTGTVNAWQNGTFLAATGATNWQATNGATLQITLYSVVEGSLGFNATSFKRNGKDEAQELFNCQRYCEKSYEPGTGLGANTGTGVILFFPGNTSYTWFNNQANGNFSYKNTKRSVPGITLWGEQGTINAVANNRSSPIAAAAVLQGSNFFSVLQNSGVSQTITNGWTAHYFADSRLPA